MDLLSELLRELRMESAGFRRLELRAPWRLTFQQDRLRGIHIVAAGRCELELAGNPVVALAAGDLVLTPRADPHVLRSPGNTKGRTVSALELARLGDRERIRSGAVGEPTVIACGAFLFHEVDHPALGGMPRTIVVRGEHGRPPEWLGPYLDVVLAEARHGGSGTDVVMARLSDALVARVLRFHIERSDSEGWLAALRDPSLARALGAMHDELARPWTVAQLAKLAGLSRAAFSARFTAALGEPPVQYLLGRRMRVAMTLLRHEQAALASVAARVGYGSEAAFATAFKRYVGVAPGKWRADADLHR